MTYTFKLSRRLATTWLAGTLAVLLGAACAQDPQANSDPQIEGVDQVISTAVRMPRRVVAEVGQTVELISASAGRRGTADAYDAAAVEWNVSGGIITTAGQFSALKVGTYQVTGKRKGGRKTDTTTVVVVPPPTNPVAITVNPDSATLGAGTTRTFDAMAVLADSSLANVGVQWTATGGSIDAGGTYVAGAIPGNYVAIARSVTYGLVDSTQIRVDSSLTPAGPDSTPTPPPSPTIASVRLTPATAALLTGQSLRFVATAVLTDSSTVPLTPLFTATGGTVDSTGLYQAGSNAGTYRVVAMAPQGLADTSVVTITAPQIGTTIYPGQSIQAAVNAFPGGTTFLLKAGVHRQQSVQPKAGDTFVGETGTILTGAAVLQPVREGSYWVAAGQTQQNTDYNPNYNCQVGHDGCFYPEQLWMGPVLYEHVTSLSALGPGRWYFDYAADKIYLSDDPAGRVVETSVTPMAFGGSASDVTIRGLVIQRYANAAQKGAIAGGRGWVVEDAEVRDNHGTGVVVGAGSTVRHSFVHHQGQLGIKALGSGATLIEDNEIAYNNVAFFGPGPYGEAGGTKFVGTDGLMVRGNFAHHNHGPGLWTDINNIRTTYENNRVEDNDWRGIFHEISYSAIIRNNVVRRNGFNFPGTPGAFEGAGILISNSPDVEVYGNTVEDNRNGIMGREDARGSGTYGAYDVTNLSVHDNIVRQTDGGRAAGITNSDGSVDPYASSANNRWARNTYSIGTNTKWRWSNNLDVSLAQWKAAGQDSGSAW